jgi:hypothetical protein
MRRCRAGLFVVSTLLAAMLAPCAGAAEPAPLYAPMPSSWEGVYVLMDRRGGPANAPTTASVGLKPVSPDLEAVTTAHLLPWARAKMQANGANTTIDDLSAVCGPAGFFRHPPTAYGYMLLQAPGQVLLVSQGLDLVGVRRIYLAPKHPDHFLPTWDGDSIGHWEGDTLVVDTVGFNDRSWLGTQLQPHTEALHVVERIRSIRGGAYLEIDTTVDDRETLTGPYSYSRYYRKVDQTYEQFTSNCNVAVGDQAEWVYFRDQAIRDSEQERAGTHP